MRKKRFILVILVLIIFSGVLSWHPVSEKVRNFFYKFYLPQGFHSKIEEISSYFSSKKKIEEENERLKSEVFRLQSLRAQLKDLEKENSDLKELLGIRKENYHYEISQVIFRSVSDEVIFINHGKDRNFSGGEVVITPDGVAVGKIEKVFQDSSAVSLVSKKGVIFDVKIAGNILGVARGIGGGKVVIEDIPQKEDVKKGDFVFTSNLSELFPPDLVVGQVEKVEKTDITSFQKAIVKTSISPYNLRNLFVIK